MSNHDNKGLHTGCEFNESIKRNLLYVTKKFLTSEIQTSPVAMVPVGLSCHIRRKGHFPCPQRHAWGVSLVAMVTCGHDCIGREGHFPYAQHHAQGVSLVAMVTGGHAHSLLCIAIGSECGTTSPISMVCLY